MYREVRNLLRSGPYNCCVRHLRHSDSLIPEQHHFIFICTSTSFTIGRMSHCSLIVGSSLVYLPCHFSIIRIIRPQVHHIRPAIAPSIPAAKWVSPSRPSEAYGVAAPIPAMAQLTAALDAGSKPPTIPPVTPASAAPYCAPYFSDHTSFVLLLILLLVS